MRYPTPLTPRIIQGTEMTSASPRLRHPCIGRRKLNNTVQIMLQFSALSG
jgi:hypothetical protein